MAKKRGLPEEHNLAVNLEAVTEPADLGDFIDEFDSPTRPSRSLNIVPGEEPVHAKPEPHGRSGGGEQTPPHTGATKRSEAVVLQPAPPSSRVADIAEPVEIEEPERRQERRWKKEAESPVRVRPPRREVGFDPETLNMLKLLHEDAVQQGAEENLSRSEVARAAIRAVYEARRNIKYAGCGRRGKWGSKRQKALLEEIADAYSVGIAMHYNRFHGQS